MKHNRNIIFVTCLALILLATAAFAVPQTINYQGRLETSGGVPVNGTVSINFAVYNTPAGGTALWTETHPSVTVTDGAFSVELGSVTPLTGLQFDEPYYLGVAVNGDAEMTPRAALQTVPYAVRAAFVENMEEGSVTSTEIADGTISGTDIAASAITSNEIADGTITDDDIAPSSISASKIISTGLNADTLDSIDSAGFAASSHMHAGADITSGTVADARVASSIARDSEIMPTVLANDGIDSTLDADLLDGKEAAEIIDAASDEVRTPISSLPVTVDTPGSYYLTGDLNVVSPSSIGITVNASDVTIDLMGFSITGPGSGTGRGIYMNGQRNVEVRNGTIKGFGSDGIYEPSTSSKGHRIINVRVKDNGVTGIFLFGFDGGHLIKDSSVIGNGSHGIYVYNGATISGSVSMRNGGYGILGTDGCSITGNTIASNLYDGINVRLGAVISGNIVKDNGSAGISTLHGAVVTGNSAYTNGLAGIYVGYASIVTGNSAVGNGQNGIYAGSGSTVKNNAAYSNDANGIGLQGNCLVDGNTTFANNQSGGGFSNISCGGVCEFGLNVQ